MLAGLFVNTSYSASHTHFQGCVVHGKYLIFYYCCIAFIIFILQILIQHLQKEHLKSQYFLLSLVFTSTSEFSHTGFYNKSINTYTGETAQYYRFQMYLIIKSCFQQLSFSHVRKLFFHIHPPQIGFYEKILKKIRKKPCNCFGGIQNPVFCNRNRKFAKRGSLCWMSAFFLF